jgi:formylglycine-generating enzyme required for sulfatase activity
MGACCTPPAIGADLAKGTVERASETPALGLVLIDARVFMMGNDGPDAVLGDGEGPVRRVALNAFSIAPIAVTNRQFGDFVRATRYITEAERSGASFVFYLQLPEETRREARRVVPGIPWWVEVADASWQRPEGPGSHVHTRPDHPVVHVSWHDAQAYCAWSDTRLPSEAEWECAARGGLAGKRFAWGDELYRDGEPRCNVWRGAFPNEPADTWSPGPIAATSGDPNAFGLYNVCGNVWEWCADWFTQGRRSLRGGSFLCHDSYCNRYRVAARNSNTPQTTASSIGFRVAQT